MRKKVEHRVARVELNVNLEHLICDIFVVLNLNYELAVGVVRVVLDFGDLAVDVVD